MITSKYHKVYATVIYGSIDVIAGDCPFDIIFVVDESSSVAQVNFDLMTSFLSALVGRLQIGNGNTRVGLVKFSTAVDTAEAFQLNTHSSVADVVSAISALTYGRGGTNTHLALHYVRTTMLTAANGDRANVPNAVVILTDGRSDQPAETQVCSVWKLIKTTSLF